MKAVRGMVDAGSGYPPHWRGESGEANLATATAMQSPTERHLLRRQQYFVFILEDILYQAYQRAVAAGRQRRLSTADYSLLFTVSVPDISRSDNEILARSAQAMSEALRGISDQVGAGSPTLKRLLIRMVFKFAGEPQDDEVIDQILHETGSDVAEPDEAPEDQGDADQRGETPKEQEQEMVHWNGNGGSAGL